MIFREMNAHSCTNCTFKEMSDPSHHVCRSPFADLELGFPSNFSLDYMHLQCLGVTQKLIYLRLNGALVTRLSHRFVILISEDQISICPHMPVSLLESPGPQKK